MDESRKTTGLTRAQLLRAAGLAGGATLLDAVPATANGHTTPQRVRELWIAAVPVTWNVIPNGQDPMEDKQFDAAATVFETVVYRRFTKGWRRQMPQTESEGGLGGPLIRARVGDTLLVHFKNLDTKFDRPHSMHFHGVHYEPSSDGAYIPGFSGRGASVKPGGTFTYRLEAGPDAAGVWPYHDHSPSMMDSIAGGLYGTLSIAAQGERPPDQEFVVFFASHLGFMTINGRAFLGNTPVFHARTGETIQWDVLTLGDEFHTFHIHGHRWREPDGRPIDTKTVGPAESFAARFTEDAPGTWLYHCHVESHMMNGMIGLYRVRS